MSDYTELVRKMRTCIGDKKCFEKECRYWSELGCMDGNICCDAAAAIEALEAENKAYDKAIKDTMEGLHAKNDRIHELQDKISELGETYSANIVALQNAQPHWVSVKEALPTCDGEYLVCVDVLGKSVYAARWFRAIRNNIPGESGWSGKFGVIKNKVTHWMPLPEPPQEVQE